MKVILTQFVRNVMLEMCQQTDYEWSAWGETETARDKKGQITSITVYDIHFVKQECGPCSTIMDDEEVLNLYAEMESANAGSSENLNCWIHSHANMEVFWSNTDDSTIDELVNGYLLSIVVNKKGDILARVDSSIPIRATIDKLPISVEVDSDVMDFCKEAVKKISKRKVPKGKILVNGKPIQGNLSGYGFDMTRHWPEDFDEPFYSEPNRYKAKKKNTGKKTKGAFARRQKEFWERDL